MLGLNKADASNEYSLRKYAPIRRRCVSLNSVWGSSASSISAARMSKISIRFLCRPSKFSSTSFSCCLAALASSRSTRPTIRLARLLSVGLRSRGSVAGLKGLTRTLAESGRRYKLWRVINRNWDKGAPWNCSMRDRATDVGAYELRRRSGSVHRRHPLELANLHETEQIR